MRERGPIVYEPRGSCYRLELPRTCFYKIKLIR
nr:MAG TPA: hypothetical protein [Crassvirales sp.]